MSKPVASLITTIEFNYNIKSPVSVYDYSQALASFNNQFNRQFRKHPYLGSNQIELEIENIECNSLKTKIQAYALGTLFVLEAGNTIIQSIQNMDCFQNYLTKQSIIKPFDFDRQDMKDIKNIIRPLVKADEGNSNLVILGKDNSKINVEVVIPWDKANIMKTQADKEIKNLGLPEEKDRDSVLLYLEKSVRSTVRENVGDEGIIEDISPNPVRLYFPDKNIKESILKDPFGKSYMVDVQIETIHNEPHVYKIMALHESFSRQ